MLFHCISLGVFKACSPKIERIIRHNFVLYVEYIGLFCVEIFSALSSQKFVVAQNSHKRITIFPYVWYLSLGWIIFGIADNLSQDTSVEKITKGMLTHSHIIETGIVFWNGDWFPFRKLRRTFAASLKPWFIALHMCLGRTGIELDKSAFAPNRWC
jgi:hypothetical protein